MINIVFRKFWFVSLVNGPDGTNAIEYDIVPRTSSGIRCGVICRFHGADQGNEYQYTLWRVRRNRNSCNCLLILLRGDTRVRKRTVESNRLLNIGSFSFYIWGCRHGDIDCSYHEGYPKATQTTCGSTQVLH